MQTWVKAAIAAATAAAAFGVFSYFSKSAKAAPSSADAAKKGATDGCAAGTADGKAGTENLNATDPSTNAALAAAAKASGDSVAYLSAFSKNYDSCFASNSKKAPAPGTPTTHVTTDCTNYATWPADVKAAWTEYEAHKADGATSAYATSGKASILYGKFVKLGCAGNASTVQATIQSWIDAGGTVTGGPDCKDLSTWPKALADTYKLYTADPRAFVDGGANNGPALVKALAAIGCPGTAAAVQHTYDLELAAGNIPGVSTSGPIAYVGRMFDWLSGGLIGKPPSYQTNAVACLEAVRTTYEKAAVTRPEMEAFIVKSISAVVSGNTVAVQAILTAMRVEPSRGPIEDGVINGVRTCLERYIASLPALREPVVARVMGACATGVCAATGMLASGQRAPKQLQKPVRVGMFGGVRYDGGKAPPEVDQNLVFRSFSEG